MPEISVADTGTGPPAPVVGSRLSFADPHRLMELSSASRGTASPVAQTDASGRTYNDKLSNARRHDADAVERRTIDQLRAHDGVDQYVLLRIDGAVDLERLEEQRGRSECDHLGLRQSRRHRNRPDRTTSN